MDRFEFYSNAKTYEENSLKHYGTIGQKWGVRHWQNADGTFNEAGKERYFGSSGKKNSSNSEEVGGEKKKKALNLLSLALLGNNQIPEAIIARHLAKKEENKENDSKEKEISVSSTPKEAKEQYKELVSQAKKELGKSEAKKLAKWCLENGIDEITDEMIQGSKAGKNLYDDIYTNSNKSYTGDQIKQFVDRSNDFINMTSKVYNSKDTKKFEQNNENFKEYAKGLEKIQNQTEKMNKAIAAELKKLGFESVPMKTEVVNGKSYQYIDRAALYKENPNAYFKANEIFPDFQKKYQTAEIKDISKNARTSLGKYEKDCHDYAKKYLCNYAEMDDPSDVALTYEKDTGKLRKTKMYETYGTYMTYPWWKYVGGL